MARIEHIRQPPADVPDELAAALHDEGLVVPTDRPGRFLTHRRLFDTAMAADARVTGRTRELFIALRDARGSSCSD